MVSHWFSLLLNTITYYGINDRDIYNFDETGFALGIASTSRIITSVDRRGKTRAIQQGDREWVTAIEAIGTGGFVLPPMVIFAGKLQQRIWYEYSTIPANWMIAISDKGWTTNDLSIRWLMKIFQPITQQRQVGVYRLLIMDGHESHANPRFDAYCRDHKIITLCMPPHSSHLLQPLDIGCFSALKKRYGDLIQEKMRLGVNYIDKAEFIPLLKQVRDQAYTAENIASGFTKTGIYPFNPRKVLDDLPPPPSPLQTPPNATDISAVQTPHNTS
jgi:hypothetical protein